MESSIQKVTEVSEGNVAGSVALSTNQRKSILFVFSTSDENEMPSFKGMRFPAEVILVCIRWCAAYPLSARHLEEMMEERGMLVDHSTVSRWAIRFFTVARKDLSQTQAPGGRQLADG